MMRGRVRRGGFETPWRRCVLYVCVLTRVHAHQHTHKHTHSLTHSRAYTQVRQQLMRQEAMTAEARVTASMAQQEMHHWRQRVCVTACPLGVQGRL